MKPPNSTTARSAGRACAPIAAAATTSALAPSAPDTIKQPDQRTADWSYWIWLACTGGLFVALLACTPADEVTKSNEQPSSFKPTANPSNHTSAPPGAVTTGTAIANTLSSRKTTAAATSSLSPVTDQAVATPARIVAVGDVHGDFRATVEVLRLAKLIDANHRWIGGNARLVQLGDFLDRGHGEREIIALFETLRKSAARAGGAVHILNGNHELMNAARRFPYVTPKGFASFADHDNGAPSLKLLPPTQRGRWAAFRPGGEYAKILSRYPIILALEGTVFVHGGVLPQHVDYGIERINRRARDFLLGKDDKAWGWFASWDSPVNSRHYAKAPGAGDCYLLTQALEGMHAKRMVVGHTVQLAGVGHYCNDRVWAVDVGLASCCGNNRQALEIIGDKTRILELGDSPATGH